MGDDHPVKKSDIETDPKKEEKLNAFRKRAKLASPLGKVNRVYSVFNTLEEFKGKIASSLKELCQLLDSNEKPTPAPRHPRSPTRIRFRKPPLSTPSLTTSARTSSLGASRSFKSSATGPSPPIPRISFSSRPSVAMARACSLGNG